jgi:hypothetical protein
MAIVLREQTLKNALSDLKKLFDRYLAQVRFEEQEVEMKVAALETSMRYFILDYHDVHAPRLGKILDSGDELIFGLDYYKYRFRYFRSLERREAESKNKYKASYVRDTLQSLESDIYVNYLVNLMLYNSYWLPNKGQLRNAIKTKIEKYSGNHSEGRMSKLLEQVILRMISTDFDGLKKNELLNKLYEDVFNLDFIDIGLKEMVYVSVRNLCLKFENRNYQEHRVTSLTAEPFLKLKSVSKTKLRNYIYSRSKMKDFEEAEDALEKTIGKVNHISNESIYNECKGIICFHKGQYDESLRYFLSLEKSNEHTLVTSRIIILLCLYKLRNLRLFEYEIESFRVFLLRERQLSEDFIRSQREFIKNLRRLSRLRNSVGYDSNLHARLNRYCEELASIECFGKRWLLNEAKTIIGEEKQIPA